MFHDVINGKAFFLDKVTGFDSVPKADSDVLSRSDENSFLIALNHFYAAFNQRDIEQSIANWAQRDTVVMCNPMGGIRRGISSIRDAYCSIMQGDTQVYVEFYDFELLVTSELSFVTGRERGVASNTTEKLELDIRTSRIFQNIKGHWQQIHHHGSMTDSGALQRYQNFLMASTK